MNKTFAEVWHLRFQSIYELPEWGHSPKNCNVNQRNVNIFVFFVDEDWEVTNLVFFLLFLSITVILHYLIDTRTQKMQFAIQKNHIHASDEHFW